MFEGATSLGTATASIGTTDADGNKDWELTFPADKAFGEGDLTITATATDEAGNVSDPPASLSITVDTTNPTVSASVDSGTYPRAQTVRLTPSETATVYYTLNGKDPVVGAAGMVKGNIAPVSTSGTLKFMAIDTAGNQSAVGSRVYRIQNARPVISNISPTGIIGDRTPLISATINDSDSNLREANITLVVDGRNIPRSNFVYNATSNRLTYQSPRLGLGRHTVRLTARDVDGGVTSRNWSFRIR